MKNNLDFGIKTKDKVFVLFYASWCPFCQKFLPAFEEFSKNNHECMKVLVDDNEDAICEKYSLEYYPTVIMFRKGKIQKRIDAKPGIGLTKNQLNNLIK